MGNGLEPGQEIPISDEPIGFPAIQQLKTRPFKEETGIALLKILAYVFGTATTFSGLVVARSYFLAEPFWPMILIPFIIIMTPLTILVYYLHKMMSRVLS